MYYEDFFVKLTYGGVLQWCRSISVKWQRHLESCSDRVLVWLVPVCKVEWTLRLIYYKAKLLQQLKSQVLQLKRLFYTTGITSRSRGEHHKYSKRWRNSNC